MVREHIILTLNAAIEAARAGEQGKGFVVVAEEFESIIVQRQNGSGNAVKNIAKTASDSR